MKNVIAASGMHGTESQGEPGNPHGEPVTYVVCDGAAKLIHSGSRLSNLLGGTDHVRCVFERSFTSEKRTRVAVGGGGGRQKGLLSPAIQGAWGPGATHRVKSVISIMIMHICLASTMMSLPLSSHLDTSASSLLFSSWKLATCSAIFAFCSWGS